LRLSRRLYGNRSFELKLEILISKFTNFLRLKLQNNSAFGVEINSEEN